MTKSKSQITFNDMQGALRRFKEAVKGRKYKDLCIEHTISSGLSTDYIMFTYNTPKLDMKEMLRQVEMNNAAYTAFLD